MTAAESVLDLFPTGTAVVDGELVIGGSRAIDLAAAFGTPTYVIDEGFLRDRIRHYRDGLARRFSDSRVYFASKALPCAAICRVVAEEGLGIDIAGGGELVVALAAGVPASDMLLHGNAKTTTEIKMALAAGVGLYVIDNEGDIDRLVHLATSPVDVLVRVRPSVHVHTHAALATGDVDSKFGLGMDQAEAAIKRIRATRNLRLKGLHSHIGSGIFEADPFAKAVEAMAHLGDYEVYDLGGGLGERYTYSDPELSIDTYLDTLAAAVHTHLPSGSKILIEPGRSLVARSGVTLYEVINVKRSSKTFVAIDGGMADNLEVSLYGQRFEATMASSVDGGESVTLVGRHCESGDELIDGVSLRDPTPGGIVAVPVTGAYCFTMANNYNGALRPPVVLVTNGIPRLVVRRETYDDILARDVDFPT